MLEHKRERESPRIEMAHGSGSQRSGFAETCLEISCALEALPGRHDNLRQRIAQRFSLNLPGPTGRRFERVNDGFVAQPGLAPVLDGA